MEKACDNTKDDANQTSSFMELTWKFEIFSYSRSAISSSFHTSLGKS